MNKVGIVIPSYNQHQLLTSSIDSVMRQTFADFEAVIVNDYIGEPDSDEKTLELERLVSGKNDDRIQLWHNEANVGISRSRNRAIRYFLENNMDYIFFLDHDDIWKDPHKLEEQLRILEQRSIGLVGTQYDIIDRVGEIVGYSNVPTEHRDIRESILLSCPIIMSSLGVRAEVFKNLGLLDESCNGTDDWEFMIRSLGAYRGFNIPDRMTQYRRFGENTSQREWHRLVREQIKTIYRQGENYPSYYKALIFGYMRLCVPQKYKELLRPLKQILLPNSKSYHTHP